MGFEDLPRAVLEAISRAAGEEYRDVDGAQIVAEMHKAGHPEPTDTALTNVMFRLRDEEYLTFSRSGEMGFEAWQLVRLTGPGLQEVDSWPKPGGQALTREDVEALLDAFREFAQNPDAPKDQRDAAEHVVEASEALSLNVLSSILVVWAQTRGWLPSGG